MVKNNNRATIMVVDDVPDNVELLQSLLEGNDYQVLPFTSGAMALNAANRFPPDLFLLDINMPEMSGYELCEKIKSNPVLKDIPIIFISALEETSAMVSSFSHGGVDYVRKPFQFEEILARIRVHLQLLITRRELERQNEVLQQTIRLKEIVEQISRHDIKGSLTAFINVPEILLGEENLFPEQKDLLKCLYNSAKRIAEMIHRPLDLFRMELGTYQLNPVTVDLIKIVRSVLDELDLLAKEKKIKFVMLLNQRNLDKDAAFCLSGEEFLFFSLLSNLIKNAIEASPAKRDITIAFSDSHQPTISIHNEGEIPREIRDRFFERYVTFGKKDGNGLGAYSAMLMAKALGGELSFETGEESGTRLLFYLFVNQQFFPARTPNSLENLHLR